MRKITKRSAALVAGVALAVTGGTAAFAIANGWFRGSASVTAKSSTIQAVTATINLAEVGPGNNLFPGKSVEVKGKVNNGNDYDVKVNSISVTKVDSDTKGCGLNEADLQFIGLPNNTVVPAGQSPLTPLGSIKMLQTADPLCSGATLIVTGTMDGEIASAP